MKDKAYRLNAKRLSDMESHLREVYFRAHQELQREYDSYMKKQEPILKSFYDNYIEAQKAGTQEDIDRCLKAYQDKLASVTYRSKDYQDKIDMITDRIAHINQEALSYINSNLPYAAANAYNQMKDVFIYKNINKSWTVVNEDTVRLVLTGKTRLPEKKLNVAKDRRWNKKKINAELLQGILQGESIPEIADRFQKITDMNRASAIRNARTLITQSETRGRLASMYRAEDEMGMVITKTWRTAGDSRVRDSHEALEGMEIPAKDTFPNGCDGPGDGPASEVWNCRCTLEESVKAFIDEKGKLHYV